ncbi:MAG: hypothetical protein HN504_05025 [Candidatus Nitrosopelagicus sp.]|nr:hypothetical protein [Candidatus Nitrosopelagicus sp.]
MTIDSIQSEDLVPYGNGEIILRNIISKRATHIPRKNIFTLDSTSFGIDELTIEKNAKGDIFLSEGVLSCGKNLYPFTRIKGIIRGGMLNSFEVTLEISEHSNLELEIRVQDSQALFKKFNELKSLEINNFEHTLMRDQINFVKDRLGLDRR